MSHVIFQAPLPTGRRRTSHPTSGAAKRTNLTLMCVSVLVLTGTLAMAATEALAQRRVQSTQEILEQLERDWVEAFQRNDVEFVDSVLAPEFVATYGDGTRGDRTHELQLVKNFDRQVDEWEVDEFIIKVYGDTAVVWFRQRMVGPVQGQPTEIVARYMDVFVNRDGKWLCVGSQSTRVR